MRVTEKDFEAMYLDLDRQGSDKGRALYLRNHAQEANKMLNDRSSYLLMYIEEISSRSLWQDKWDHDVEYKTLKRWADREVGPIYVNGNTETILAIVVRIVENIFPYVKRYKLQDRDGNPITPKYLIKKVGFGPLKIVSNNFQDNIHSDQRDKILINLTVKTVAELKELYSKSRIADIHYTENPHPDGGADIFMFGLDEKQRRTIGTALQKLPLRRQNIQLSSVKREAIISLLSAIPESDEYNEDDMNE